MKKETFVKAINALKEQHNKDGENSVHLSKVFTQAFEGNLFIPNIILSHALIEVLKTEMGDKGQCKHINSWIEYFLWELDFGRRNDKYKVYDRNREEIPMSTPEELYDFLSKDK
jgi:hypothetical protein